MSTSERALTERLVRLREEGVVMEASRHYVVDDLEPLGEVSGPRYEIIDGELYMSPVPKRRHQIMVGRLHELLLELVKSRGRGTIYLAPVGVVLAPDRLVSPDIVVLRPETERAIPADEDHVTVVPDLVIEILSPGTAWYDRSLKRDFYERAGIPEYWIVDGEERRVHQFLLGEGGYAESVLAGPGAMLESNLLGEAAIAIQDIFSELP